MKGGALKVGAALFILAAVAAPAAGGQPTELSADRPSIIRRYSDLRYDTDSKDLVGVGIRLVPSACGHAVSVRFGGEKDQAPEIEAVEVVFDPGDGSLGSAATGELRFRIPEGMSRAGSFVGLVFRDRLEGVFLFSSGREMTVTLPLRLARIAETLRGLRGVAVNASRRDSGDLLLPPGYEASVKSRLQLAGIPILPYDNDAPGHPLLLVIVTDDEKRVDLELRQDAWLSRDPRIQGSTITWWYGFSISAEDRASARVPAYITQKFIDDYLRANLDDLSGEAED